MDFLKRYSVAWGLIAIIMIFTEYHLGPCCLVGTFNSADLVRFIFFGMAPFVFLAEAIRKKT